MTDCKKVRKQSKWHYIVYCLFLLILGNHSYAQSTSRALSEEDILRALRRGAGSESITKAVRKNGINFVINEKTEADLRDHRASESLIDAIKELSRPEIQNSPPLQPPTPAPRTSPATQPDKSTPNSGKGGVVAAGSIFKGTGASLVKTPVLFQCDADCSLTIDGLPAGSLKQGEPKLKQLSPGDHLIEVSALGTDVKWRQSMTLKGSDQIIKNIDLQPLLLAEKAKWLIGTWTRKEGPGFNSDRICATRYDRSGNMKIYVKGDKVFGDIVGKNAVSFPNARYDNLCEDERRWFTDYEVRFTFVVTELFGQTATVKVVGDVRCDGQYCEGIIGNLRKYVLKLSLKPERTLDVDFWTDSVNGEYN